MTDIELLLNVKAESDSASRLSQSTVEEEKILDQAFEKINKLIGDETFTSVTNLSQLAESYVIKAEKSGLWTDFYKAHGLFNACGKREPENTIWYEKAFEVELKYQKVAGGKTSKSDLANHHDTIAGLKKKLTEIRIKTKSQLSQADTTVSDFRSNREIHEEYNYATEKEFCVIIKSISEECWKSMVSFVADIMSSAEQFSGQPACEYAVVAIGSLAKCEITPYSDLEYFILTANDENMHEFERLAVTSYFIISDLRESHLISYAIEELPENVDDCTKYGFQIDGLTKMAGNIPTGHGPGTVTNNKFIKTVDEMAFVYEDILRSPTGNFKKKDLTVMLSSMILVYGNEKLYEKFISRIRHLEINEARKNSSLELLQYDIKEFNFLPDESLSKIKQVKIDIFRFPSLIVTDLKIYYQLASNSVWNVLEELKSNNMISASIASSIEFIMCVAQYVRLITYLNYDAHNDSISVLPAGATNNKLAYFPQELFLLMCLHLIPLKKMISLEHSTLECFKKFITGNRNLAAAYTYYYLNDYHNCLKYYDKEFREVNEIKDPDQIYMYIKALEYNGRLKDAMKYIRKEDIIQLLPVKRGVLLRGEILRLFALYDEALITYLKGLEAMQDSDIALAVSEVYMELGLRKKGFEHLMLALEMPSFNPLSIQYNMSLTGLLEARPRECKDIIMCILRKQQQLYGESTCHPDIASSCNHMGMAYLRLGDCNQAQKYFNESLKIWRIMYENSDHPHIASLCNNIGSTYTDLGDPNKALEYYNKSLEIYQRMYDSQNHPHVASSYNNIGRAYLDLGDYSQALSYHKRSLEIWSILSENSNHPDVATSYNNIGSTYYHLGDYHEALSHYNKSLEIRMSLYANSNHPDIADSYHNVGITYAVLGDYNEALSYHKKSLKIRKVLFENSNDIDLASSYKNIGRMYSRLGDNNKALNYYKKSLQILMCLHKNCNHPEIVFLFSDIGDTYSVLGKHNQALKYYNKSLEMQIDLHKNGNHLIAASSYDDIGRAYYHLGYHKQAMDYYNKSLETRKGMSGNSNDSDMAASLNNLGNIYFHLGDYNSALNSYSKSLEVVELLHGTKYHQFKRTLHNEICAQYLKISHHYDVIGRIPRFFEILRKCYLMCYASETRKTALLSMKLRLALLKSFTRIF